MEITELLVFSSAEYPGDPSIPHCSPLVPEDVEAGQSRAQTEGTAGLGDISDLISQMGILLSWFWFPLESASSKVYMEIREE